MNARETVALHDVATAAAVAGVEKLEEGVSPEEAFELLYRLVRGSILAHRNECGEGRRVPAPKPSDN